MKNVHPLTSKKSKKGNDQPIFFCSLKCKTRCFIISKKLSFKNQQTSKKHCGSAQTRRLRVQPRQESSAMGFRKKQVGKGNTADEVTLTTPTPPSQMRNEGNVTIKLMDQLGGWLATR